MALTDPENTLAYHGSRVFTTHRDMSDVHCTNVAAKLLAFQTKDLDKNRRPEHDALWFYGMNHGMALIAQKRAPLEPLSEWENAFVRVYHDKLAEKAVRAFYYLMLICTRESRHNKSLGTDKYKIAKQFGQPVADFFSMILGGEAQIAHAFKNNPPNATIGDYVGAMRWAFYNSKWSNGYGGKKWGAVTDCLERFVKGEFTAEMMMDTVWTLAHNGGPIFNKGEFYAMYSSNLYRILDVQRSGQIPEMILHDTAVSGFSDDILKCNMQALEKVFPGKIRDYVDWHVVEALGSVHKYPHEKQLQIKKYGLSPEASAAEAKALAAAIAVEEKEKQKKAEHEKKWFKIGPNAEVEKIQIERAA